MARVNIDENAWGRFEIVQGIMGWEFPEFAAGFVSRFWRSTQDLKVTRIEKSQIAKHVGFKIDADLFFKALVEAEFLEQCEGDQWLISGNLGHINSVQLRKETNKKYYEKKKAEAELKAQLKNREGTGQQDEGKTSESNLKTSYSDVSDLPVTDTVTGTDSCITPYSPPEGDDKFQEVFEKFRDGVEKLTNVRIVPGSSAKRRFQKTINTPKKLQSFLEAIDGYLAMLAHERDRMPKKSLETFIGTKRSGFYWEQWVGWSLPENVGVKKQDPFAFLNREGA